MRAGGGEKGGNLPWQPHSPPNPATPGVSSKSPQEILSQRGQRFGTEASVGGSQRTQGRLQPEGLLRQKYIPYQRP